MIVALSRPHGWTMTQRRSNASSPHESRDFVTALERGLRVLQVFSSEQPEMTLSEIAARTGLSPATARRCLITLQALGYIGSINRRFVLRAKVLTLGSAFLISMNLKEIAQPYLQELADEFRDSTSLVVLEGADVVYLVHVPSKRLKTFRAAVGYRTPAYATSLGHVLLANLPAAKREAFLAKAPFPKYTSKTYSRASDLRRAFKQVVKDDYASTRDQFEYGVLGIAVPIRTADGQVVVAVGCSAEANRVDMDTFVRTRLPRLREVATELSRAFERTPALVHSIQSTSQVRPT